MAGQKDIILRQGDATAKDIILRELPAADAPASLTLWMFAGDATPKDIILRDPTATPVDPGGSATIASAGIGSTAAIGQPALAVTIASAGIASAAAVGQPTVTPATGAHAIESAGIPSTSAVGSPTVYAVPANDWHDWYFPDIWQRSRRKRDDEADERPEPKREEVREVAVRAARRAVSRIPEPSRPVDLEAIAESALRAAMQDAAIRIEAEQRAQARRYVRAVLAHHRRLMQDDEALLLS